MAVPPLLSFVAGQLGQRVPSGPRALELPLAQKRRPRVRRGDRITLEQPAIFGEETALIEIPVSWTLDDYPHFEFVRTPTTTLHGLMNADDVLQNWIDDFLYLKQELEWGVITYTFHPFVIGRGHRMIALEKLLRALQENGATFLTMEQAVQAYTERAG